MNIAIIHPLWLGEMPAIVKGFLEQVLRPRWLAKLENLGLAAR